MIQRASIPRTRTLGPDQASVLIRFIRMQTVTSPMPYSRIALVRHRGRAAQIHTDSALRWIQESDRLFEIRSLGSPLNGYLDSNGHNVLRAILYNGRLHRPNHAFFGRDSTLC